MRLLLYDGWDLVHQPNSPAAIHLLRLLNLPLRGMRTMVALPGSSFHPLPPQVEVIQAPLPAERRLLWEQRLLPTLVHRSGASGLHVFSARPPLFLASPVLVSPAGVFSGQLVEQTAPGRRSFAERARAAFGLGGLSRSKGIFWPVDWPEPEVNLPLLRLPRGAAFDPSALEAGQEASLSVELPETFVLYHGSDQEFWLRRLLAVWSWAAGSIGLNYPLVLAGLSEAGRRRLSNLVEEFGVQESVQTLPLLPLAELTAVYLRCACLLHPAPLSPWGDAVASALALARPVVALETAQSAALVGPAAYLVPEGEQVARLTGAALLTVIVEENVAASLSQAAQRRSQTWKQEEFVQAYESWLERMLD